MRSKEELERELEELEKLVICCGEVGERYWDGTLICSICGGILDGDWEDLGRYKALKWVIEDEA
jgi:hypothetical protein